VNCYPFCRFVADADGDADGDADMTAKSLSTLGNDYLFIVEVSPRSEVEFLWLRTISANSLMGSPGGSLQLPGEQVVLVTGSEGGSKTGRDVSDKQDYERIKNWLRLCGTPRMHQGVCTGLDVVKSEARPTLPSLRAVEVVNMCLTNINWRE
jgi:hypothetical protein